MVMTEGLLIPSIYVECLPASLLEHKRVFVCPSTASEVFSQFHVPYMATMWY
jgi:hypothetical protein